MRFLPFGAGILCIIIEVIVMVFCIETFIEIVTKETSCLTWTFPIFLGLLIGNSLVMILFVNWNET